MKTGLGYRRLSLVVTTFDQDTSLPKATVPDEVGFVDGHINPDGFAFPPCNHADLGQRTHTLCSEVTLQASLGELSGPKPGRSMVRCHPR